MMKPFVIILLLFINLSVFAQQSNQSLDQKLFTALDNKAIDESKSLIRQGANVNATYDGSKYSGSKGWTVFLFAMITTNDIDFMRYLIQQGANPKQVIAEDQDKTVMHFAANYGLKDMMTYLTDQVGISIDAIDKYDKTPLFYACMSQYPNREVIQFMIDKGAKPNKRSSDGTTALNYAIGYEAIDLVKVLVENGADVNNLSTYGSPYNRFQVNTLGTAISYGNVEIFNYLLSKGVDYQYKSLKTSPLHLAASWGFPYAVNKLLALGLDKTRKDLDDKTPLNIAVEKGRKMEQQLLMYGPSANDLKLFRLMEDAELNAITIKMKGSVEGRPKVHDLTGKEIDIAQYKGKVTLVNFWATWCGPCIREMPSMKALKEEMGSQFQILAISVDKEVEKIPTFDKARGPYPFTYLHDPEWALYKNFYSALPGSYLIGKDGTVLASVSGSYQWDQPKVIELIKLLGSY